MWEQEFGKDKIVNKDSPDDMKWIFEKAEARSQKYGISGVTYNLTMGVVKNIIPAIASTNAIISAACVTEVIKILSGCNHVMDNYMQYMGQTGVNTHTYVSERTEDCLVCKLSTVSIIASKSDTLVSVFAKIKEALPET
jgi:ubiquitin-activating enzyme E1 C